MIIHPEIEQGTEAWLDMRRAKITASEIGSFAIEQKEVRLTIKEVQGILDGLGIEYPKKAKADELKSLIPEKTAARLRTHTKTTIDARKALYAKKIAEKSGAELLSEYIERITGYTPESLACKRGKELEEEARHVYELVSGENVETIGFVEHDNGLCGASPDGVIGLDESGSAPAIKGGLEIKCHSPEKHIVFLRDPQKFEDEHKHQIHWQMAVMCCEYIDLFGYCPKLPYIRRRVWRSAYTERFVAAIDELSVEYKAAIDDYNAIFAKQRIELAKRKENAA